MRGSELELGSLSRDRDLVARATQDDPASACLLAQDVELLVVAPGVVVKER